MGDEHAQAEEEARRVKGTRHITSLHCFVSYFNYILSSFGFFCLIFFVLLLMSSKAFHNKLGLVQQKLVFGLDRGMARCVSGVQKAIVVYALLLNQVNIVVYGR